MLIDFSVLTPAIIYDTEFAVWVRSNAKINELEIFAESVFAKLQEEVLSHKGVMLDHSAFKK